jgi:hypothetical protein
MNIKLQKITFLIQLFLMTIVFVACDNYKPNYAEPTIEKEKMAKILKDVHVIEAHLQNIEAATRDSIRNMLYDQLFKIHNTDTTEFYRNHKIYFSHSELVEPLYDDVLLNIEEEMKSLEK